MYICKDFKNNIANTNMIVNKEKCFTTFIIFTCCTLQQSVHLRFNMLQKCGAVGYHNNISYIVKIFTPYLQTCSKLLFYKTVWPRTKKVKEFK